MCAIRIIQNGISSVIYFSDKYNGTSENTAAKRLFSEVGISVQKFNNSIDNIFIDINNK
jgi:deoxycytidylate deaminase